MPHRLLVVIAFAALGSAVAGVEDGDEVPKLIKQLGSDTFAEREAASRKLEALGEKVWYTLRRAAEETTDPEVRRRAGELAEAIEQQHYKEVLRLEGHEAQINQMVVSTDVKRIVTSSLDESVRAWDVPAQQARRIETKGTSIWGLAITSDGKRFFTSPGTYWKNGEWAWGPDYTIREWDFDTCKEVGRLEGHTDPVLSL